MFTIPKTIQKALDYFAMMNVAGMLYKPQRKSSFFLDDDRFLTTEVKSVLRKFGFRELEHGDLRWSYANRSAGVVVKFDKYFDPDYKKYLCKPEAQVYAKQHERVERESKGKVILAPTVLVSKNICAQQYFRGREPGWDDNDELRSIVHEVTRRVKIMDIHDGNWFLIDRGRRAVVFDLASDHDNGRGGW